jgi:hypothetical protein
MVNHLFADFLDRPTIYDEAVRYWLTLWDRVVSEESVGDKWRHPWLGTGSDAIRDGNPIFTAYSPLEQKGIRVIQYAPTKATEELQFWFDTYGGSLTDPMNIRELVIACALSDEAALNASRLIGAWLRGEGIHVSLSPPNRTAYPIVRAVTRPSRYTTVLVA